MGGSGLPLHLRLKHVAIMSLLIILVVYSSSNNNNSSHTIVTSSINGHNKSTKELINKIIWRVEGPLIDSDPLLIQHIRSRYLHPPSNGDYNLMLGQPGKQAKDYNTYRSSFSSWIRTKTILEKLFAGYGQGFFVEAGALDGEFISNSLFLEMDRGWNGLLIEADPRMAENLRAKGRKAWSSHSCISPSKYATKLDFLQYEGTSRSISNKLLIRSTGSLEGVLAPAKGLMGVEQPAVKVQCFPLYSFLLALNQTSVDYISLDVEGAEGDILLNFPWDDIKVKVWNIEHRPEKSVFTEIVRSLQAKHHENVPQGDILEYQINRKDASGHYNNTSIPTKPSIKIKDKPPVIYRSNHDPAGGKDNDFIQYMKEKGYTLIDYWDGDYTYIATTSELCRTFCNSSII